MDANNQAPSADAPKSSLRVENVLHSANQGGMVRAVEGDPICMRPGCGVLILEIPDMRFFNSWKRIAILLAAGMLLSAGAARGCSVPVFRYALERWPADPYGIIVFHRGDLSEADQAIVDALEERAMDEQSPANLRVFAVDLDGSPSREMSDLWKTQEGAELPWMVVLYPVMARIAEPLWSGRLTKEAADSLADSPKRREIARRILDGESAVWVLLECGDKARDEAAATTLSTQLGRLQELLELPFTEEELQEAAEAQGFAALGAESMMSTLPLRLAFSVVRVSRDDPAEQVFVHMLMKTEPDLHEYIDQPMVFPVFGRGRALFALVGRGINERTMESAGVFLAGACSCVVKAMNPGADLLISANWEGVLANMVSLTDALPTAPPAVQTPPLPPALADDGSKLILQATLIALAALLAIVLAGTATIAWVNAKRKT